MSKVSGLGVLQPLTNSYTLPPAAPQSSVLLHSVGFLNEIVFILFWSISAHKTESFISVSVVTPRPEQAAAPVGGSHAPVGEGKLHRATHSRSVIRQTETHTVIHQEGLGHRTIWETCMLKR